MSRSSGVNNSGRTTKTGRICNVFGGVFSESDPSCRGSALMESRREGKRSTAECLDLSRAQTSHTAAGQVWPRMRSRTRYRSGRSSWYARNCSLPLERLIRPDYQVVTVPRNKGASTTTALDDFQFPDLLLMPWPNAKGNRFQWRIGPYFVFPTSTSQFTRQGAWQMGPAWAFSYRGIPRLQIAGLFQQGPRSHIHRRIRCPSARSRVHPILWYQLGRGMVSEIGATRPGRSTTVTRPRPKCLSAPDWGKYGNRANAMQSTLRFPLMDAIDSFDHQTEQFTLRFGKCAVTSSGSMR